MFPVFWRVYVSAASAQSDLDRIEKKIVSLTEAALAEGKPYLLSELGLSLGDDLVKLKSQTQRKLVDFIRERLSDRFQIIQMGVHSNIYAIIDAGAEGSHLNAQATPAEFKANKQRHPRYHYRFWAAFSVPPTQDSRAIDLRTFTFRDAPADEDLDEHEARIDNCLIPAADTPNRDEAILASIRQWVESSGFAEERFFAPPAAERGHAPASAGVGTSLLELVLETLDKRQQQTTSLSLDVVGALLRKRV